MTNTTVTPAPALLPATTMYLPGRTVEVVGYGYGLQRAIVVDVDTAGTSYTLRLDNGRFTTAEAQIMRAVHPDRAPLAHDQFIVSAFGEQLAARAGEKALAGFHNGHNDGRIAYTEAARGMLAEIDRRAFAVKHSRCSFTFVEAPDGTQHTDPTLYNDGDHLVECDFYVDGPGTPYCGFHRVLVESGVARSSIFHAGIGAGEQLAARARGEVVSRPPIVAPSRAVGELAAAAAAPAGEVVEVPRVMTEVEARELAVDLVVDAIVAVLLYHAGEYRKDDRPVEPMPGPAMRQAVEALLAERGTPLDPSLWWDAQARAVRRNMIRLHQGPAFTTELPFRTAAAIAGEAEE